MSLYTERPIKSLSELMDGGVEERFNDALTKIWSNVYDPNTKPTQAREINLKIKVIPNERRDSCNFKVNVTTKMAPPIEMTQTVMLSLNGDGSVTATERTAQIPGQIDMDGQEAPLPNVMTFRKEETN